MISDWLLPMITSNRWLMDRPQKLWPSISLRLHWLVIDLIHCSLMQTTIGEWEQNKTNSLNVNRCFISIQLTEHVLRGETLNYKIAQDGCYGWLLSIRSWAHLVSWGWFLVMFLLLEVAIIFGSHDHIWPVSHVTWKQKLLKLRQLTSFFDGTDAKG